MVCSYKDQNVAGRWTASLARDIYFQSAKVLVCCLVTLIWIKVELILPNQLRWSLFSSCFLWVFLLNPQSRSGVQLYAQSVFFFYPLGHFSLLVIHVCYWAYFINAQLPSPNCNFSQNKDWVFSAHQYFPSLPWCWAPPRRQTKNICWMNTCFEVDGEMVPGLITKGLPRFIFGEKIYLEIILMVIYILSSQNFWSIKKFRLSPKWIFYFGWKASLSVCS